MSLAQYNDKRDFKTSPEPRGKKAKQAGNSFVIQKHAARRLHYDFRLEMDGVLKSWAVTKGPSLVPGEKRLAVHVEDHPLDYGTFEGTIPEGQYGAGEVIVWDRGTWEPIGDLKKAYKKGHLEFALHGEKLEGRWHLVRMAGKPEESRENWLLIKAEDEFARTETDADILEERPASVKSGLDLKTKRPKNPTRKAPEKAPKPEKRTVGIKGARTAAMPDFVEPQLATLVKSAPSGERWLHEVKLDGYRLQAHIKDGVVRLLTRTGLDWTERFGTDINKALQGLPARQAIIDGEVAVESGSGATDFSLLQQDLSEGRSERFVFHLFDLLYLDGQDLTKTRLVDRKAALERLLNECPPNLRYSEHFRDEGGLVLKHACRLSLEGIISKLANAPYKSGRGRDWVKSKCSARQEFVIAGYVPSTVSKSAIGSLVMGYYEDGVLQHAGRVGTGFLTASARSLFKTLAPFETERAPFETKLTADERRNVVFVEPKLVAEVEFRGWTADAHLRHASFRGLREDKEATAVVRETAPDRDKDNTTRDVQRSVKLTHPDRIYWPDAGVSKAGLADYYAEVWPFMAPFVVNRPLSLVRGPDGITKPLFFQKHAWKGMTKNAKLVIDPADEKGEQNITIRDLDGLLGLVQGGTLEIHPWGSSVSDWERADMVIIDLDPGEGTDWQAVMTAAGEVRSRFEDMGLTGFLKTSGGKGLHIVAPVKPKATWPTVKAAMKALADSMASDNPGLYVSTVTKSKRRGKILIDYLRNGRGATAVAPYSARVRPGAPVSMPIAWNELDRGMGPAHFTVENASARLRALGQDPWADFRKAEAPINHRPGKK
ncbi:DNA ligase D [Rhizobium lemnae]|uniref:DNA ligase (ATP) n=1 Tax=Rhizobium lemnae TaxID=1214924 RepID=A0ABV8E322_9HYPH|nr:DNA ligase D [Rhizobium lemnae]MCJ8507305.1 DNA ligase D [Rhizobium lemnae]